MREREKGKEKRKRAASGGELAFGTLSKQSLSPFPLPPSSFQGASMDLAQSLLG
jgi:hypothetical protein